MKEKVKVLTINTKKKRKKPKAYGSGKSLGDFIEEYAHCMYSFSEVYVRDAIDEGETLRPEIILITQDVFF